MNIYAIAKKLDVFIGIIIFATILAVIFFSTLEFYKLYAEFSLMTAERVLYTVSLTIIFVKAYSLLIYYLKCGYVSVKYIVEISIIAPAIEILFAPEKRPIELNILFAVFSVVMLIVYVKYHKTLAEIESTGSHRSAFANKREQC